MQDDAFCKGRCSVKGLNDIKSRKSLENRQTDHRQSFSVKKDRENLEMQIFQGRRQTF